MPLFPRYQWSCLYQWCQSGDDLGLWSLWVDTITTVGFRASRHGALTVTWSSSVGQWFHGFQGFHRLCLRNPRKVVITKEQRFSTWGSQTVSKISKKVPTSLWNFLGSANKKRLKATVVGESAFLLEVDLEGDFSLSFSCSPSEPKRVVLGSTFAWQHPKW